MSYARVSAWVIHCRVHKHTIQGFIAGKWRTARHYPSKRTPKAFHVINDCRHVFYINTDPHVTKWFRKADVHLEFDGLEKEPDVIVHCWRCGAHGNWNDIVKTSYGPGNRGVFARSRTCMHCNANVVDKDLYPTA